VRAHDHEEAVAGGHPFAERGRLGRDVDDLHAAG
jgi:hypothetical protein